MIYIYMLLYIVIKFKKCCKGVACDFHQEKKDMACEACGASSSAGSGTRSSTKARAGCDCCSEYGHGHIYGSGSGSSYWFRLGKPWHGVFSRQVLESCRM